MVELNKKYKIEVVSTKHVEVSKVYVENIIFCENFIEYKYCYDCTYLKEENEDTHAIEDVFRQHNTTTLILKKFITSFEIHYWNDEQKWVVKIFFSGESCILCFNDEQRAKELYIQLKEYIFN